ncbi:MAG: hypothetical protein H6835_15535 [Planctomycetes bacterium]|nr:hypothetical protein [Planctomycetota bacterium]
MLTSSAVVLGAAALFAQDPVVADELWRDDPAAVVDGYLAAAAQAPVEVVLLGTFHFDDQGLDEYQPQHHFDALEAKRQQQIEAVVAALAKWQPDLICVERRPNAQPQVDADYRRYRDGELRDRRGELAQLAYRLAAQLGHERVHAIDADGRALEPRVDPVQWAVERGVQRSLATPLLQAGARYTRDRDRFIDREDLSTILRFFNHERVLEASHAVYLVGKFRAADGEQFPGPDGFVSQWHNRNLRIFSNLCRVAKPGQRVLVLFGVGHMPILRQCVVSSPEFRLVEVADVIPKAVGASPDAGRDR